MEIKACIFDLDGVIVDTAKFHYIAWKELARELGFDFTEEDNEQLKGVSRTTSLEILLKIGGITLSEAEKERYAEEKNTRYLSWVRQMTPEDVLPGVLPFLMSLKDKGIAIALGSASKNAPLILERVGLSAFFDAVVDGTMVSKAKPDPQVFQTAAELLGTAPENCIVFEDARAGIEAAHRAGMKAVGVGSQQQLPEAKLVIAGFEGLDLEQLATKL
ncbi:MAG: beta-phosphoglucomutase [Bacteroidota bacterium]